MSRFSQRMGIVSTHVMIQKDFMNMELRNSLWTVVHSYFFDSSQYNNNTVQARVINQFLAIYYFDFIKRPVDEIHRYWTIEREHLKSEFFSWPWYKVYDFIEFWYQWCVDEIRKYEEIKKTLNLVLERESSAYRVVNDIVAEVTSDQEISEIESSLSHSDKYAPVKAHLSHALSLMSDRNRPDYRNSGKESISAVESLVKIVTASSNGTLGQLIKELERSKVLPPTLKSVYSALYGYASQEDGIRHALIEESRFEYPEARYMLIVCSAFVNYVIEVSESKKLQQETL